MHAGLVALYERSRGECVESIHFGAFAVVDSHGNLLASHGDPQLTTYLRSSAKPIQALPFVEAGGPAHFGFTGAELAFICASHTGTPAHAAAAAAIQAKANFEESHLQCGVHPPFSKTAAFELKATGQSPGQNHNNCSGKHSGMLAFAKLAGWRLEDYLSPDHPVQQAILKAVSSLSGLPASRIGLGTDGCSAPNFAMPLYNAALATARMADPSGLPKLRRDACRQIIKAMTSNPEMVAGPGEFDTQLMKSAGGSMISKGGADGYQVAGVLPGVTGEGSPGLGIAIKISDGDLTGKVRAAIVLEFLKQNRILSTEQLSELADFGPQRPILNVRKTEVGQSGPIAATGNYTLNFAHKETVSGSL